jgi:hypothetical protein
MHLALQGLLALSPIDCLAKKATHKLGGFFIRHTQTL